MVKQKSMGRVYSIVGIVSAILSLVYWPFFFGLVAVAFGIIGIKKGDARLGTIAIILGVVLAIMSYLIGVLILSL
ncbi:hypothetical protein ACFLZZ_04735 [Nanoarchaeota archaeon]